MEQKCDILDEDKLSLHAEQKRAIQLACDGHNLFLTGSAGTGKTVCSRAILRALRDKGRRVEATGTTGIAAIQIGGPTIFSFSGLGMMNMSISEIRTMKTAKLTAIWQGIDTLLIDEISMLKPDVFEKLSVVAQVAREDSRPFGGVQVIACGDFFQLPPVWTKKKHLFRPDEPYYCFESPLWKQTFKQSVELTQVYRQSDPKFIECLQRIRKGQCTDADCQLLQTRHGVKLTLGEEDNKDKSAIIRPTQLHSMTEHVDKINSAELAKIQSKEHLFQMIDGFLSAPDTPEDQFPSPKAIEDAKKYLHKNVIADEHLALKVGAQVMLLVNLSMEYQLMNGSRGVVISFTEDLGYPVVKFDKCKCIVRSYMWKKGYSPGMFVYVAQIPLKLAYAYTIHKSQSQSMDCVELRLDSSVWEEGMAYTALSRVRTLYGLTLSSFTKDAIRANPRVIKFYEGLGNEKDAQSLLSSVLNKGPQLSSYHSGPRTSDDDQSDHDHDEDADDNDEDDDEMEVVEEPLDDLSPAEEPDTSMDWNDDP
jgi:ATP-dependent DNA helicase PIF1